MTGWLTYVAAVLLVRHLWFRGERPTHEARVVRR
jgi:hypothetical protein